eukprot:53076-Chlamydomonas_euryale.AAC.2
MAAGRQAGWWTGRQAGRQVGRQAGWRTGRQAGRQAGRVAGGLAGRQASWQTGRLYVTTHHGVVAALHAAWRTARRGGDGKSDYTTVSTTHDAGAVRSLTRLMSTPAGVWICFLA